MSIKLFYCHQCDRYYSEVRAKVVIKTTIRVDGDGEYWITDAVSLYDEPVEALEFDCPVHDNHSVVEKTLEKCPHEWEEIQNAWRLYRECRLCGAEQEGKVVYD